MIGKDSLHAVLQRVSDTMGSGLEAISFGVPGREVTASAMGDLFLEVREGLTLLSTRVAEFQTKDAEALSRIYLLSMDAAVQFDSPVEAGLMLGMDRSATILVDCEYFTMDMLTRSRLRTASVHITPQCTEVDFAGEFDDCEEGPWCDVSGEGFGGYGKCWVRWLYWCAANHRAKNKRPRVEADNRRPKIEDTAVQRHDVEADNRRPKIEDTAVQRHDVDSGYHTPTDQWTVPSQAHANDLENRRRKAHPA
jgi:hypothetical protein